MHSQIHDFVKSPNYPSLLLPYMVMTQTSTVECFLKTLDFQAAINDLKVEGINKSTMCALLLTKTLDKSGESLEVPYRVLLMAVLHSEDERTHISKLLGKLVQANVATSSHLREVWLSPCHPCLPTSLTSCVCVFVCVCMCVCVCVCVFICMCTHAWVWVCLCVGGCGCVFDRHSMM